LLPKQHLNIGFIIDDEHAHGHVALHRSATPLGAAT
jgi:hypothetical protein